MVTQMRPLLRNTVTVVIRDPIFKIDQPVEILMRKILRMHFVGVLMENFLHCIKAGVVPADHCKKIFQEQSLPALWRL